MICTTLRVERPEGSVLARGMAAQIEQAAPDDAERLDAAGSRAFDIFWMYTTGGVPAVALRRGDALFDERYTDPETGQPAKYRVSGLVEVFDDHIEALCERVIGG